MFEKELRALLNKHSKESGSNTPDYVLADYLMGCLDAFNTAMTARDSFYGVEHGDGNLILREGK